MQGIDLNKAISLGTLAVAVVSIGISYSSLNKSNELSTANYAERIKANELRVEQGADQRAVVSKSLAALKEDVRSLQERGGELNPDIDARLEELAASLAGLQQNVSQLSTKMELSSDPTAKQVANVIVNEHLDQIIRAMPSINAKKGDSIAIKREELVSDVIAALKTHSQSEELLKPAKRAYETVQSRGDFLFSRPNCKRVNETVDCIIFMRNTGSRDNPNFGVWADDAYTTLPDGRQLGIGSFIEPRRTTSYFNAPIAPGAPLRFVLRFEEVPVGVQEFLNLSVSAFEVSRDKPLTWNRVEINAR